MDDKYYATEIAFKNGYKRAVSEIFEEIDEICHAYNRYEIGERGLFAKLADLKKKYAGENYADHS